MRNLGFPIVSSKSLLCIIFLITVNAFFHFCAFGGIREVPRSVRASPLEMVYIFDECAIVVLYYFLYLLLRLGEF